MPYKMRHRNCANCGEEFAASLPSRAESYGVRIYCSRRCTLQYQRASRAHRLTDAQKANALKASRMPATAEDMSPAIHTAEGARLRQEHRKKGQQ